MWRNMKTVGNLVSALFGLYLIYSVGLEVGATRERNKKNKKLTKLNDEFIKDVKNNVVTIDLSDILK